MLVLKLQAGIDVTSSCTVETYHYTKQVHVDNLAHTPLD